MAARDGTEAPLIVAVAVGPAISATWCMRDRAGDIVGVAADLGRALAERIGRAAGLKAYASSGAIVEDAVGGGWDFAFLPADAERKRQVLFGPNYFLGTSTYLVAAESGLAGIDAVDRTGIAVAGIENTATLRAARKSLRHAEVIGTATLEEAVALFENGGADALAFGRESLLSLEPGLKRRGRILPGHFHAAGSALAVPLGHEEAARLLGDALEAAKADGAVRRLFDRHGLADAPVAPAGSRP